MLEIRKNVLCKLTQAFLSTQHEQGFILGSKLRLGVLDYCEQIPATQAGIYFYTPDAQKAELLIQKWYEQEICFCGFIHSHVMGRNDLSQNDIEFAKDLFKAYNLSVLWFGLGVVRGKNVDFQFYAVTAGGRNIDLTPVCWKVGTSEN